jgi:Domain of unknown function (DUF397)
MADLSEVWRRSSFCANGSCVEVAMAEGRVALRDSKDPSGPVLHFDKEAWEDFLVGSKTGMFDRTAG